MSRDKERFLKEFHNNKRSEYVRDKGRIVHSSYFRRLSEKTQVITKWNINKISNHDILRNRLTHSLEVAQIGSVIANRLNLVDMNLVETSCLAHDIGHPPFGHNGEKILDSIAYNIGGFEGNAQTFRVLTRLASKKFLSKDKTISRSVGLNLTRGVLNGVIKYPYVKRDSNNKFNAYKQDLEIFNWVRKYSNKNIPSLAAQIMDFSDDVAYSVSDIEDTIYGTKYQLKLLDKNKSEIVEIAQKFFYKNSVSDLHRAIDSISNLDFLIKSLYSGEKQSAIDLKNMTSELIGRFSMKLKVKDNLLVIPKHISAEIAILKAFGYVYFINTKTRKKEQRIQKKIIEKVYLNLKKHPNNMAREFYDEYKNSNKQLQKRIIIDQIATLTDDNINKFL
jgi:dGTPase